MVLLIFNLQSFAQINEKLIGDRIWMTSNLNISKFQNGDPIYEAKTKAQWNKASKDKKPTFKQRNPLQLNCPLSLTTYIVC